MNKNSFIRKDKLIIIGVFIFIIGITLGSAVTYYLVSDKEQCPEPKETEKISIKKSRFSLNELYEITDNPERFYIYSKGTKSQYNFTMTHFYDYFNTSTTIKVAAKVKRDTNGKVIKVLETKYINYDEYMALMKPFYDQEKDLGGEESSEDYNFVSGVDYYHYVENLIYPNNI